MFKKLLVTCVSLLALNVAAHSETVLNRGNRSDPSTLDQHRSSTVDESRLLRDLYEGLVTTNAEGKLIPGVAASWDISPDGLLYTFHLRDGAKWSNGDPVIASDFEYSLRRIMDPKTAAGYASILFPIKNAEQVSTGKLPLEELGVKALDDKTLQIALHQPTPYFVEILTHQTALPLHRKTVEQFGDKFTQPDNLITNGAYTLQSYRPNDVIVMQKNPNFWDAANVQIDKINWIAFTDDASCMRRFEAKEVDICPNVAAEQLDYVKANLGQQYHQHARFGVFYMIVKGEPDSKLRDPRVREALSLAIDRDFIAEKVMRGSAEPAISIVPQGTANYVKDAPKLDFIGEDILDREDKAKALLKEAGVEQNTLTVKLRFASSENNRNIMSAIASLLKNIGIRAQPDEAESASYFNLLQDRGMFDTSYAAWIGDYDDPNTFLSLYTSDSYFNYGGWSNKEYDELVAKAGSTLDMAERAKLFANAEKILLKDSAYIPIVSPTARALVADKVENYIGNLQDVHATRWISVKN